MGLPLSTAPLQIRLPLSQPESARSPPAASNENRASYRHKFFRNRVGTYREAPDEPDNRIQRHPPAPKAPSRGSSADPDRPDPLLLNKPFLLFSSAEFLNDRLNRGFNIIKGQSGHFEPTIAGALMKSLENSIRIMSRISGLTTSAKHREKGPFHRYSQTGGLAEKGCKFLHILRAGLDSHRTLPDRWNHLFRFKNPKGHARRSEEHTSELQSRGHLVCRHLLEKKIQ